MNTFYNRSKQQSQEKIEKVFILLLQTKELYQITVTDICKKAKLNRSTFYVNYLDVYDLADKVKEKLEEDVFQLYKEEVSNHYNSNDYLKLFKHIKENQLFYQTYFKLGYDTNYKIAIYDTNQAETYFNNRYIDYHIEFFKSGLTAIIKKWLYDGCRESPEEMESILKEEYSSRE